MPYDRSSEMPFARWLVSLLGAEYQLLKKAQLLNRFYLCSMLIVATLLLTAFSISHAIELLFHSFLMELFLSAVFTLLFTCMYVFLLNTFAKENNDPKNRKTLANIIRTGFIAFIGFLMAQPLVIQAFETSLNPMVANYQQQLEQQHFQKIEQLVKSDLQLLSREKSRLELMGRNTHATELQIEAIQKKAAGQKSAATQTIHNSSFFLYRVEQVNRRFPLVWLLTASVMILFLSPGYLVFSISAQHSYYVGKKEKETALIMDAYEKFAERWTNLFEQKPDIFTRFIDPPFNTTRKQPIVPSTLSDFLRKYLENS